LSNAPHIGGIDAQIDRCGEFVIVHAAFKVLADVLGLGDGQIGKLGDAKIVAGPVEL
jgi:hypothetical protein